MQYGPMALPSEVSKRDPMKPAGSSAWSVRPHCSPWAAVPRPHRCGCGLGAPSHLPRFRAVDRAVRGACCRGSWWSVPGHWRSDQLLARALQRRARLVRSRARASPQRRAAGHGAGPRSCPRSCSWAPGWRRSRPRGLLCMEVSVGAAGPGSLPPREAAAPRQRAPGFGEGEQQCAGRLVVRGLLRLRPSHGDRSVPSAVGLRGGQCLLSPEALVPCADVVLLPHKRGRAGAVHAGALGSVPRVPALPPGAGGLCHGCSLLLAVQEPSWLGWQRLGSPGWLRGRGAGGNKGELAGQPAGGGTAGFVRGSLGKPGRCRCRRLLGRFAVAGSDGSRSRSSPVSHVQTGSPRVGTLVLQQCLLPGTVPGAPEPRGTSQGQCLLPSGACPGAAGLCWQQPSVSAAVAAPGWRARAGPDRWQQLGSVLIALRVCN